MFKAFARKGKSSMGWFYGYKLHMVINNLGQIIALQVSAGNVADNNADILKSLLDQLQGYVVGDKGYLSKLFSFFFENGLHLLSKPRKNMKKRPIIPQHNKFLDKRAVIESVFDILTSICDIEHSRHRSPTNAAAHFLAGLIAYQDLDKKPQVFFPSLLKKRKLAA